MRTKPSIRFALSVLTMRFSDGIGNVAQRRGAIAMAWFDKNTGGKKSPDAEIESVADAPKLVVKSTPLAVAEVKVAAKSEPVAALAAGLVGYLYKGSRVSGNLSFQGPARIDGVVEGDIQCQGALTIGESAEVKAKITAQSVVVHGRVEGNVSAKEKIELIAPARLIGNIDAPRLIIAEGVVFEGDCSMGVAKQKGGVADSRGVVAEIASVAQGANS
jgi:cytoskeletal protein CcmA (bactofilin family)